MWVFLCVCAFAHDHDAKCNAWPEWKLLPINSFCGDVVDYENISFLISGSLGYAKYPREIIGE